MSGPDTHDVEALAGAMYFVVGRATEGGQVPYQLSIAGVTVGTSQKNWGKLDKVAGNSGYSLGAIQVDLGQRGTWPLGATEKKPLEPGQCTYVDALIAEVAQYAEDHHLKFASDREKLRETLLSHGGGGLRRGTLKFLDEDIRDTFNAWASSESGQKWIHRNIDYPQIRNATKVALAILDADGRNITEDHRLETVALLAKTANQMPSKVHDLRQVLRDGGDYDALIAKAKEISRNNTHYDGLKAVASADRYLDAFNDVDTAAALNRAQAKVARAEFNPAIALADTDFREALNVVGRAGPIHVLRHGSRGNDVSTVQRRLAALGFTGSQGQTLQVDGDFGAGTQAAVEAFQRAHGLKVDGRVGPKTLEALQEATRQPEATLADRHHPGHPLFCQALEKIHLIDARCGRVPDELSNNLAGSLAAAAHGRGLERIDHVVLGENATRAFAVQGELDSPFRRFAGVDILQAVARPLAQSSADFRALPQSANTQSPAMPQRHDIAQPAVQEVPR